MITKITMKDIASYKKEAVLETDRKTNLVYGLNGTGKSTLSGFLYNMDNPEYDNCKVEGLLETDKVLVYNQQFIQDNFYETEDIYGIFTLSKENKRVKTIIDNAQNNINILLEQKIKLEADADDVLTKYQKQISEYQNNIWKIKTEYSGGDRVLEYCLEGFKGKKEVLFQHLVSLDMPIIEPIYNVEDLKKEIIPLQGDSKKMITVDKVQFNVSIIEDSTLLTKEIVGNKASSVSILIEKIKNSDWVNQGLQYVHLEEDGRAICPFCQQKTVTDVILKEIEEYFDESYQKDKEDLIGLLEKYQSIIQNEITNIQKITQNDFFRMHDKEMDIYIAEISSVTTENIHRLQEKIKMPSMVVYLEKMDQIVEKINLLIDKVNLEICEYNKKIDNKQTSLKEVKEKFWKLMRFNYNTIISLYEDTKKHYEVSSNEIKINLNKNEFEIKEQQKIIRENRKKTVNIDEAVDNIKRGLLDIGISDFTIEKYSDEQALYHLKREKSDSNIFKSLSEGEKMVISFLYFIELCKGETQAEATATGKIIVIDDPISSLSHIYIFNIGRIIQNEFLRTEKYEQIFVLSHSLYFFYELTCTNHGERKKLQKLFRLCKNDEGSSFIEMKYEEIQNDYQAYWQIIKDNTQPPALIANCMRNIMEYFFNFVEKQDFAQVFDRPELQEIRFAAFNRYMNRESHSKGQNIFDIKEFNYDNFKDAFKLVFEVEGYELHYKKMMK